MGLVHVAIGVTWLIYRLVEVDDGTDLHGETGDGLSGR
jgi:hypothetical protein